MKPASIQHRFSARWVILVVCCLALSLSACGSKRTPENLTRIKNGMTSAEVKSILGKPDRVETATILGLEGSTFFYDQGETRVQISFINDAVTVKLGSFGSPDQK
jgi:hypothetical protein